MSTPSSSKPSDVRVKMLQTEVSILQQKIKDLERDQQVSTQRLQRSLEISWRKDLKQFVQQQQQEHPQTTSPPPPPESQAPAVRDDMASLTKDQDNGNNESNPHQQQEQFQALVRQVQNLERQLASSTEKKDSSTIVATTTRRFTPPQRRSPSPSSTPSTTKNSAGTAAATTPTVMDPTSVSSSIEEMVRLALEKHGITPTRPEEAATACSSTTIKGVETQLQTQAEEIQSLRQELDSMRQQQPQPTSENPSPPEALVQQFEASMQSMQSQIQQLQQEQNMTHDNSNKGATATTNVSDNIQEYVAGIEKNWQKNIDGAVRRMEEHVRSVVEAETKTFQANQMAMYRKYDDTMAALQTTTKANQESITQRLDALQSEQTTIRETTGGRTEIVSSLKQTVERLEQDLQTLRVEQEQCREAIQASLQQPSPAANVDRNSSGGGTEEFQDQINTFWNQARQLEMHLSEQFTNQERYLQEQQSVLRNLLLEQQQQQQPSSVGRTLTNAATGSINTTNQTNNPVSNHEMDQIIETWDGQLAELIEFVEQTIQEQALASLEWQQSIQLLQQQQTQMQSDLQTLLSVDRNDGLSSSPSKETTAAVQGDREHIYALTKMIQDLQKGYDQWQEHDTERYDKIKTWIQSTERTMTQQQQQVLQVQEQYQLVCRDRDTTRQALDDAVHAQTTLQEQLQSTQKQCEQYQKQYERLRGQKQYATQIRVATLAKRKGQIRTLLQSDDAAEAGVGGTESECFETVYYSDVTPPSSPRDGRQDDTDTSTGTSESVDDNSDDTMNIAERRDDALTVIVPMQ